MAGGQGWEERLGSRTWKQESKEDYAVKNYIMEYIPSCAE